jgi:hypothetical protein
MRSCSRVGAVIKTWGGFSLGGRPADDATGSSPAVLTRTVSLGYDVAILSSLNVAAGFYPYAPAVIRLKMDSLPSYVGRVVGFLSLFLFLCQGS